MVERVAVLTFGTINPEKNYVVKIKDVKEDITKTQLTSLMSYIITNKVFNSLYGDLLKSVSCKIDITNTKNMSW